MTLSRTDLLKQDELWILLFILGIILLNWPFLSMVGKSTIFGYPLILIYLAIIWLGIVLLAYLFDKEAAD
jgi:hypothetical protein